MGGLGQTDEEGKKFAKFDDVVAMCETAVKTPDSQGTYADYVGLLKLYDKNSNGTMMLAELDNFYAIWETRFLRLMYKRCSLRSVILRTKTVCSPTCLSSTGSLERPNLTFVQDFTNITKTYM